MTKLFNCIMIVQMNDDSKRKVKFTKNLKQRIYKLNRKKAIENYSRLTIAEFDTTCSKQELLSLAIEHENFTSAEDQWLLSKELARLSKVEKKREYKSALTNISAEELLEAIK